MPTRRPTPKVTAAARMPSSICRSPLYHQGRLVNRAVITPAANSPAVASTAAAGRLAKPSRYGSSGMNAPTVNDTSEENAAVHGEGRSSGSMPSSSRACTRQAWSGSRDSCSATLYAVSLSTPRRSYIIASSRISARGRAAISRCSTRISAAASSAWLATEVYSPVAIEIAPATRPASPVSTTVVCGTLPPATPAISAKFDTRPSITPKTAGRSQPPVTSRWRWWISIEPAGDSRGGSAVTVRGYVGGLSVRDRAGRLPGLAGPLRGLADHLPGLADHLPGLADHLPGLADHLARFGLDHLVGLADRLAGCGLRRSARSPRGLCRVGRRGRLPGLPRSARRPSGVLRVGRLPAVGRRGIARRRLDVGLP